MVPTPPSQVDVARFLAENPILGGVPAFSVIHSATPTVETTSLRRIMRNAWNGPGSILQDRPRVTLGLCFSAIPCKWTPWCCSTKTEYDEPTIKFFTTPKRIPKATFVWKSLRIEGKWQSYFQNQSTEGTKRTTTTCKCRGGNEKTTSEPVPGSANVTPTNETTAEAAEKSGALVAKVTERWAEKKPGEAKYGTISFSTKGTLDTLKALWSYFVHGTMKVKARVKTTITYTWLGQTKKRTFDQTMTVTLPVDDLDATWS